MKKNVLVPALGKFRALCTADESAASQLLAVGEAPRDSTLPATETAIWMLMASTAQNLDATLNK